MYKKMLTAGEILRIQTNLNEIEKCLGHPIPGGIIDASTLKDHILSGGEVLRITNNIREIEKRANVGKSEPVQTPQIFDERGNVNWVGVIAWVVILGYILLALIFG